ncbi:MAG: 3-dehydroquinate synthase family protein [Pseudobdellovibrio sp.]
MTKQHLKTQVIKVSHLPTLKQLQSSEMQTLVIFDQILLKKPSLRAWLKQFDLQIAVKAGETLKTLDMYAKVLSQIQNWQKIGIISKKLQFVAIGGGSVGDFVGFVASTYQRGCPLIQIPSTWLSAIDSAHGGKTGLNLNGVKNQIGTFYLADKVILSRELLLNQPEERLTEAFGEIIKICLINKSNLLQKINYSEAFVWKHLEQFISGKTQVVEQDLYETTGLRQILNLGHTMGHVYESCLSLSHGRAVLMGLVFSLRWSYHLGYLNQKDLTKILQIIMEIPECEFDLLTVNALSSKRVVQYLVQDKKIVSSRKEKTLNFIFILKPDLVFSQRKTVSEIVKEFERQKLAFAK